MTHEAEEGDITTLADGLNFPTGAAYDADGNLYFSDWDSCRIREVHASSGSITTVAGNGTCGGSGDGGPATAAELGDISGLALDGNGHLAVATNSDNDCRVREIDLNSHVITTVAGNGTCGFAGDGGAATSAELALADHTVPSLFVWSDIAFDSSGNLYIADIFNCRIRKVGGGTITTYAGSGSTGFTCGSFSGDGGPATAATLNQPSSVGIDHNGNVYIGELGGCRVRKVAPPTSAAGGFITTVAGTGTCGSSGDDGPAKNAKLSSVRGLAVDSAGDVYISQFTFSGSNGQTQYCEVRRIDVSSGKISAVAGTGTCGDTGDGADATAAKINQPGDIALACNGDLAFPQGTSDDIRVVLGVNDGGDSTVCN